MKSDGPTGSKARDRAVRGVSFAVGAEGEALFSVRGGVEVDGTGADGFAVAEGDGVGGADSFEEAAVPGADEVAGPGTWGVWMRKK